MPIYEYACEHCGERFEKLVRRLGDEVSCPSCEGTRVDRQLSVFVVASVASGGASLPCEAGRCSVRSCDGTPCGGGCASANGE